ncbi:MAG: hypothetical protein ACYTG4_09930 [Planctomycetota bacterium]|jgi:hypothetical protein
MRKSPAGTAFRSSLLVLVAAAALGCASLSDGENTHGTPVLERERPVPSAPRSTDWLAPFGHNEEHVGETWTGFRPFYRRVEGEREGRTEILFPLYRSVEDEYGHRARLFPLVWDDLLEFTDGPDRGSAVLPLVWWGNEPETGAYFLFLPFGGTAKQKFLTDESTFVLFPLYVGTRTGEYEGTHLVWPLVHWGSGGGKSSFRVLPLFMTGQKDGVHERRKLLWPIIHWGTEDMDTAHPRSHWMVWPLIGRDTSEVSSGTTLLWPFFSWFDGPRSWGRDLPFPFYRRRVIEDEDGEKTLDLLWLWPFYGRSLAGKETHLDMHDFAVQVPAREELRWYAWPLVWDLEERNDDMHFTSFVIAPIWTRRVTRRPEHEQPHVRTKFWPLFRSEVQHDGSVEWSSLSIIPMFHWRHFEANWGIFWELVRRRDDPDGSWSTDLLFSLIRMRGGPQGSRFRVPGLFCTESDDEGSRWSLLEGLVGHESKPDGSSSLQLLWFLDIPVGSPTQDEGSGG